MPTTKEITVYKFSELSDSVKKKLIEKYREHNHFFHDFVLEDAERMLGMFGFSDVKIYYSGFWSQGDGACFTGKFNSTNFKPDKILEYAPQDEEIHRIAEQFRRICAEYRSIFFSLVSHNCRYSHSKTVGIVSIEFYNDVDGLEIEDWKDKQHKDKDYLLELSRDLMNWIYKRLEEEYEYQNSVEVLMENMADSDREYLEDGRIFN